MSAVLTECDILFVIVGCLTWHKVSVVHLSCVGEQYRKYRQARTAKPKKPIILRMKAVGFINNGMSCTLLAL